MSEPTKNNPLVVHLTADELRAIIREEIERGNGNGKPLVQKEWLKASELAELYGLPKTFFEERGRAGDIGAPSQVNTYYSSVARWRAI